MRYTTCRQHVWRTNSQASLNFMQLFNSGFGCVVIANQSHCAFGRSEKVFVKFFDLFQGIRPHSIHGCDQRIAQTGSARTSPKGRLMQQFHGNCRDVTWTNVKHGKLAQDIVIHENNVRKIETGSYWSTALHTPSLRFPVFYLEWYSHISRSPGLLKPWSVGSLDWIC